MTITSEQREKMINGTGEKPVQPTFERSGFVASLLGALAGLGTLALLSVVLGAGGILLGLEFGVEAGELDLSGLWVPVLTAGAVVILVSSLAGGFVAGRVGRYGGIWVGLGSGLWLGLMLLGFVGLALGVGAVSGALASLDLPTRLSEISSDMTIGVAFAGGLVLVGLLGGLLGGWLGQTDETPARVIDLRASDAGDSGSADIAPEAEEPSSSSVDVG